MAKILDELKKLGVIDTTLVRLKKVLDSAPGELTGQKEMVEQAKGAKEEVEKAVRECATEVDRINLDVKAAENEIVDLERKISIVKNNKEYQIVTERIGELKKVIGESEERGLALMEKLDSLRSDLEQKNNDLEAQKQALVDKEKSVEEDAQEIRGRQQELAAKRREQIAVLQELDAEVLPVYSTAMKKGRGQGLAELKGGACQGCFQKMQPNIISNVLSGAAIDKIRCPGCGRILYTEVDVAAE